MKVLFWLLYFPLLVIVAAFAAANRHSIDISFDPLPLEAAAPLFVVVLASALIGLVFGGAATWVSGRQWRRDARRLRRSNALLETELIALRERAESLADRAQEGPMRLPDSGTESGATAAARTTPESVS